MIRISIPVNVSSKARKDDERVTNQTTIPDALLSPTLFP